MTKATKPKPPRRLKVQFYRERSVRIAGAKQAARNDWRWRLRAENGRIVGASSEGYKRRWDCGANFELATGLRDIGVAEWRVSLLGGVCSRSYVTC